MTRFAGKPKIYSQTENLIALNRASLFLPTLTNFFRKIITRGKSFKMTRDLTQWRSLQSFGLSDMKLFKGSWTDSISIISIRSRGTFGEWTPKCGLVASLQVVNAL